MDIMFESPTLVVVSTQVEPGRREALFHVISKVTAEILADVRWSARGQCYALFPRADTAWDSTALKEMAAWCYRCTKEGV